MTNVFANPNVGPKLPIGSAEVVHVRHAGGGEFASLYNTLKSVEVKREGLFGGGHEFDPQEALVDSVSNRSVSESDVDLEAESFSFDLKSLDHNVNRLSATFISPRFSQNESAAAQTPLIKRLETTNDDQGVRQSAPILANQPAINDPRKSKSVLNESDAANVTHSGSFNIDAAISGPSFLPPTSEPKLARPNTVLGSNVMKSGEVKSAAYPQEVVQKPVEQLLNSAVAAPPSFISQGAEAVQMKVPAGLIGLDNHLRTTEKIPAPPSEMYPTSVNKAIHADVATADAKAEEVGNDRTGALELSSLIKGAVGTESNEMVGDEKRHQHPADVRRFGSVLSALHPVLQPDGPSKIQSEAISSSAPYDILKTAETNLKQSLPEASFLKQQSEHLPPLEDSPRKSKSDSAIEMTKAPLLGPEITASAVQRSGRLERDAFLQGAAVDPSEIEKSQAKSTNSIEVAKPQGAPSAPNANKIEAVPSFPLFSEDDVAVFDQAEHNEPFGGSNRTGSITHTTSSHEPKLQTSSQLASSVGQQIAVEVNKKQGGIMEIALNPEELGRVSLTMKATEGSVAMVISAERPETQDLMRRHIETLAQEFRTLGYKDISFSFQNQGQRESNPDRDGGGEGISTVDAEPAVLEKPKPLSLNSGLDLRL